MGKKLNEYLEYAKPFLEACSFAVCVYDNNNELIFSNNKFNAISERKMKDFIPQIKSIKVEEKALGVLYTYVDISNVNRLKNEVKKVEQKLRNLNYKVTFDDMPYESMEMREVLGKAKKIAITNASVFLFGEVGVGKDTIARAIHNQSPRNDKSFIKVDCAVLSKSELSVELFGYSNSHSSIDPIKQYDTAFDNCNHGTLYIESIHLMPMEIQERLLDVIRYKELYNVNTKISRKFDIRYICSSTVDLLNLVDKGLFNEELYTKLSVFTIKLPPLNERKEDIPSLIRYFINYNNVLYNKSVKGIEDKAVAYLKEREWKENVGELRTFINRVILDLSPNEVIIEYKHLVALDMGEKRNTIEKQMADSEFDNSMSLDQIVSETEKKHILMSLERNNGDKNLVAKELQVPLRTLYYKCNRYNI